MSAIVFVGPTLYGNSHGESLQPLLDASFRAPAAQGDVLCAALEPGTRAIAIIDGYYERVPSVWHKEILWAMAQGIHVFGAGSLGALRAAELHPFGMEGVGAIYAAFAQGELEDDDEVALVHAPAQHGYRPGSEPLVNVRATLSAARRALVISEATERWLIAAGKALFYPDRVYPRILADARQAGASADELAALERFLPAGKVDQKRADALELLELLRGRLQTGLAPKRVSYRFEHSENFERALSDARARVDKALPREDLGE